jgi:hypothetical protein
LCGVGYLQATLCIHMIGQGSLLANGSSMTFGPLAPGCGGPASVTTDIHADLSGTGGGAHTSLGHTLSAVEVGTHP